VRIDASWYTRPEGISEHVAAGGVVVRADHGHIFVALVREGEDASYVLPKGHVETGESLEDAARREIREEAGLADLVSLGELGVRERLNYRRTSWKRTHYFLFLHMRASDPFPGGRAGVAWASIDALPAMFWPEQRALLETNVERIMSVVTSYRRL
jgi:8-oxo-dGTP pyrophosphatase MutT (NUDIX family)